jgi:nicotinamide-nucleotide amidase
MSLAIEASRFFQGGITAYNLGQKSRHLRVDPIHAMACNSVSPTTADQMALNALTLFSSDWAVSTTGYASPIPELGINDLFAFYSIAFRKEIVWRGKVEGYDNNPLEVQVFFANHVLKEFSHYLVGHPVARKSAY